jgi:hypothetical protein
MLSCLRLEALKLLASVPVVCGEQLVVLVLQFDVRPTKGIKAPS